MKSHMSLPIGIFDSGIGGTSIWKEITALLPHESTIYLADSKNAPYGQKTKEEIVALSIKNTELLLKKNCKIIVVACNTATTNTIQILREKFDVSFIGIEPAIKPAALKTTSNIIGILATKGTLNSELFEKTSSKIDNNIEIVEQIGEGLVELIEDGNLASEEMQLLLKQYLDPMLKRKIDHLVLGCTHYPYLIPQIKKITNNKLTIIDSGKAVATQLKAVLEREDLINRSKKAESQYQFFINKDKRTLERLLSGVRKNIKIDELNF